MLESLLGREELLHYTAFVKMFQCSRTTVSTLWECIVQYPRNLHAWWYGVCKIWITVVGSNDNAAESCRWAVVMGCSDENDLTSVLISVYFRGGSHLWEPNPLVLRTIYFYLQLLCKFTAYSSLMCGSFWRIQRSHENAPCAVARISNPCE